MIRWILILITLGFAGAFQMNAQDTLFYLNGKKKLIQLEKNEGRFITYSKWGKDKFKTKKNGRFFAVGTDTGMVYCYFQDTIYGDDFTVEQMAIHVKGIQDAREFYKNKKMMVVAVPVGAASGFLGFFWGWSGPLLYTLGVGVLELPKDKIKTERNKHLLDDDFYVEGYRRGVTDKNVKNAFISSSIGFISSLFVYQAINKE